MDTDQLLQGMLPTRAPAVPPEKTGDTEAGDSSARYPWRFRGQDTSASSGCLAQGGRLPSDQGDLSCSHSSKTFFHKHMPVPLPQTGVSEGTKIVQSPHSAITEQRPTCTHLLC